MKYRVYGHTSVTVVIEVEAESEDDAYDKAYYNQTFLEEYAGNGGLHKLVGVSDDRVSIGADEDITYDDIELIKE